MHLSLFDPASTAPFALFDDNLAEGGDLLLHDLAEVIECTGPDDVGAAFRRIHEAGKRGQWVALAAHYELGHALEPRLHRLLERNRDAAPLLSAWVFRRAVHQAAASTAAQLDAAVAALGPMGAWAGLGGQRREREEVAHCHAVELIRDFIGAGDCYQVNLTLALAGHLWGHPLALYRQLRAAQPVRYGAFIRHPAGNILSRSPELFVAREGDRLTCKPMKGTAPGDWDPADLVDSAKDRAENVMIVDLIRNDLGRLAPPGGVQVERLFEAEAYPSLWQMTSTVSAAPVTADLETVFRALFPCGSVTGAPKIRAMEIIHELETHPRGLYCGALGWVAPPGDFRFNVPIRTLAVDAHGHGRLGVGSGIVSDSNPEMEWHECLLKGSFLTDLVPPLQLIETLRREPDPAAPYPLLAGHLERLATSAAWFGFDWDPGIVLAALHRVPADPEGRPQRVRLTLGAEGHVDLSHEPLAPLPAGQTVVLSPLRVTRHDPLLRHKTTARQRYDAELARVTASGHFDALFCNEQDELCEGARSNVFLRIDGKLLTPAAECGLLNGVLRRGLLARGKVQEALLTRADLRRAEALYVGNALRGLIPVTLTET
jgi:para-aminobenzoate synthetase / 4-amino-4-deoxychorismate lyase